MKVVVIGGVAAGMSAASKIKRMDPQTEVVVYEKGGYLSYGACGLPYYVGGFNDDYTKMIARSREEFEKSGIKTHLHHEVLKVIPSEKQLLVRNHETGDIFIESYDKMMISTGASAVKPPVEGIDKKGVYQLKTLEDGLRLKEIAADPQIKNVVVVGGGYIGIESVDAFLHLGKNVTCVEFADRILMPFDKEIAALAEQELISKGVNLRTSEKVVSIQGNQSVSSVVTDKGEYQADLVVLSVGVRPATEFLRDTGIHMAQNGALVVDREMKTSISDIWAAGDCSLVYHKGLKENAYLALGTVANKCGRIAGENIMGKHIKFTGALGSAAIKVCNLEMGRTGLGEAEAKKQTLDYKTVIIQAMDHPPYYPDPTPITIKLIYEAGTKRLLGAQSAGIKGAVMRVDVFAVAIHNNMTTDELGMTDLVYAPPFAGVWDAVHIAANAAK
ncbi:CoA-disulfide reductase [Proteocatella sphenisci]|uniref:CoA-disulfide reductase n=1 Tax=Proteocatella sphenisci TaxID=181070 RepID=UPI00048F9785|nr:CoA-disulfide reductase [Proteocatella sphenisci]